VKFAGLLERDLLVELEHLRFRGIIIIYYVSALVRRNNRMSVPGVNRERIGEWHVIYIEDAYFRCLHQLDLLSNECMS